MKIPEKKELYVLYCENKKSTWEISKMYGVSQMQICRWLKKLGIPARSYAEASKLTKKRIQNRGQDTATGKDRVLVIMRFTSGFATISRKVFVAINVVGERGSIYQIKVFTTVILIIGNGSAENATCNQMVGLKTKLHDTQMQPVWPGICHRGRVFGPRVFRC